MRTSILGSSAVVLASLSVQAAWALTPGTAEAPRTEDQGTRLEVKLGRGLVPGTTQVLGWVLTIDGVRVEAAQTQWEGSLPPGPHTIGVQVHYWRDLKTLVTPTDDHRLGFTFVAAGGRWVGKEYAVDARPASVVRIAATLDDNPDAILDRLLVVDSVEKRTPQLPVPALGDDGSASSRPQRAAAFRPGHGQAGIAQLVQERSAWVAALVSPQLVQTAGRGGKARARFAVDADGYVREVHLDSPTGAALIDRSVEDVLRLAEPYPPFDGYLTVDLLFATLSELPRCPLSKEPNVSRSD